MFRGSLSVTAAILLQLMTGASGGLSAGVVADMMKFAQAAKALWKFDRILVLRHLSQILAMGTTIA